MKISKTLVILACALTAIVSCKKATLVEPYPRNFGEEYLTVSEDSLDFIGRGGSQSVTISSNYDGEILTDDCPWITPTAGKYPGDTREFRLVLTAEKNLSGEDREGDLIVKGPTISYTVHVSQPAYIRPEIPETITTAEEFKEFFEDLATYVESDETIRLGASIDMGELTITKSAEYFNGTFDGGKNTVSNLKANGPLVVTNNGKICNLVIGEGSKITPLPTTEDIYIASIAGKNYGTIEACENRAEIEISGERTAKTYIGGMAGYSYAGSLITKCVNRGEIRFVPENATANAYIGGMSGYSYGDVTYNDNYGPITCEPAAFTAVYHIGGIVPRQETGSVTNNKTHKEAKIHTNKKSKSDKSYIGGCIGRIEGTPLPATGFNEVYCDIDIQLTVECYIGALQGWQAKVEKGASSITTLFEGSIVNSNISAYTAGSASNGNNPCKSAGFVTGRFSGQSGKETLHYGNADQPIKVSGSLTCLKNGTKLVASSGDYKALLDGDGSKTSVNNGAVPEADYNTIKYEVVGDGQTGPSEDLVVTLDPIKLGISENGGATEFIFKANYDATIETEAEWISFAAEEDVKTVVIPVSDGEHTVAVYVAENPTTVVREGKVSIKLPMGTYKEITIVQEGQKDIDPYIIVSADTLRPAPAGEAVTLGVTANFDGTVTTEADWITINPEALVGDETKQTITITASKNNAEGAAYREAAVVISVKDLLDTVIIAQDKFVYIPKTEIATTADFMDFVTYGADPELYPADFTVKLTADIDLSGKTLDPIANYIGTFDGQGHSLKNWACDGPLFAKINGEGAAVKNLVIANSCSVKLKFEKATANGTNYCLGIICGDVLNGTIDGCINNAKVELATNGTGAEAIFLGAIAGRTSKSMLVKNCVNNGDVTVTTTSAVSKGYRVAGVVAGSNGNIENCTNNGNVELSPASITGGNFHVGGVSAYLANNNDQVMTGCVNNGKVSFTPAEVTGIADSYVGGLLAYLNGAILVGKTASFRDCKNFGDVYSSVNKELVAVGGLLGWVKAGDPDNPNIYLQNSVVNCNVTAGFASVDGTATNPCQSAGIVIGRVKQSSGAASVTATCGTVEEPVKVAGSVTMIGGSTVTATATNYLELIKGSGFADTNNKFHFNGVYEAVTKE